ncbi:hypothetical protein ACOSQ2_021806 [Xanthoceras sorbifolium]
MGIRRQMMTSSGMVLNTITPCAACKLLRRRCAEDCPFAPFFSPQEPEKFAAVHRIYGASNVSKLLMEVPEDRRAETANSLVFEANMRLRDPVYGCMGAISALQQHLQSLQSEIIAVRTEILKYQYREANSNVIDLDPSSFISNAAGMVPNAPPSPFPSRQPPPPPPPQQQPTPTPPPSIVLSSTSSSSSNNVPSLYTPPTSGATPGYGSFSSDGNMPYFD